MIFKKMLKDKKGEKLLSIWWFFVIAVVATGITVGVLIYYSASIDMREAEAELLSEKIFDCVVEEGFVVEEIFEEDPQNEGRWGRGRDYGSIIHRLFEWAVKGVLPEDEESLIRHLLMSRGESDRELTENIERAKTALEGFRSSQIWHEIEKSDAVYTEVPFAVPVEDEKGVGILRGIIDLVYQVPGGWKIVDYKTGVAAGESEVEELAGQYVNQVNAYAEQWEDITGEEVIEKGLWLVDCNHWLTRL